MIISVFKTNVLEQEQANDIPAVLSGKYPDHKINFDLSDCDKILRVQGKNISAEIIIKQLNKKGYQCEVLV